MTTGSSTASYAYDGRGNLVRVQVSADGVVTNSVDYLVDAMGRRIGRKEGSGPWVHWIYAPGMLAPIAELDASGVLQTVFVYTQWPNVPDYIVRGGKTFKVVTDHLGSVRRVVDVATGAVVQRVDYEDSGVGAPLVSTEPGFSPIPFGFAGGMNDATSGLVHFGAREYSPRLGVWTRRDPVGFAGRQSNLLTYADGDPVNRRDSSGLKVEVVGTYKFKMTFLLTAMRSPLIMALYSRLHASPDKNYMIAEGSILKDNAFDPNGGEDGKICRGGLITWTPGKGAAGNFSKLGGTGHPWAMSPAGFLLHEGGHAALSLLPSYTGYKGLPEEEMLVKTLENVWGKESGETPRENYEVPYWSVSVNDPFQTK